MRIFLCLWVSVVVILAADPVVHAEDTDRPALTLEAALVRALEHSPQLKAATQRIGVTRGQIQQARLIPNPELEWEGEDISGSLPGISRSQHTFVLSQTIELGGKRSARVRFAESATALAQAELDVQRLDFRAEVTRRFLEVLASQRELALLGESIYLAESLSDAIQRRVNAGAAAAVEVLRARMAVTEARLDSARMATHWSGAKKRLAALWGETEPEFDSVAGVLPPLTATPDLADLLPLATGTPQLTASRQAIEAARHGLRVAKSLGTPDVSVSAGPRLLTEEGQGTFVLGLSLPLPLFNRNQGAIAAATQEISAAEFELENARTEWNADLSSTLSAMDMGYVVATTIREIVLPRAATVFREIERGYNEGRFTYLDLLTAEQDLINARKQLLEVEAEYHRHRIEAERLIGRSMQELEDSDVQ